MTHVIVAIWLQAVVNDDDVISAKSILGTILLLINLYRYEV